jgi:hypothetical protein
VVTDHGHARDDWQVVLANALNATASTSPFTETEARLSEWQAWKWATGDRAVPLHVDDDPVERADTRHGLTIADSSTARRITGSG